MADGKSLVIYIITYVCTIILGGIVYYIDQHGHFVRKICKKWFVLAGNIIIALPFALICGLRAFDVGYDTANYIKDFSNMATGAYEEHVGSFDYLYKAVFSVLAKLTNGNQICVLLVMALITLIFVVYALEKISNSTIDFILLLSMFFLYLSPIMLDQSRQLIAVGVVMLAYTYLIAGYKKEFVLFIIIATLFHETAIIFIGLIIFDNKYLNKRKLGILIGAAAILTYFVMPQILNLLFRFVPTRFEYITIMDGTGVNGKAWIVDMMPMFVSMVVYYLFKKNEEPKHNVVAELTAWSAFPLRIASYYSFFIMRMSYYGEAISIILVSYALKNVKGKRKLLIAGCLLTVYIFRWWYGFVILKLNDAIPYNFYWDV